MSEKLTKAQRRRLLAYGQRPGGLFNRAVEKRLAAKGLLEGRWIHSLYGRYIGHGWHLTDAGRRALAAEVPAPPSTVAASDS